MKTLKEISVADAIEGILNGSVQRVGFNRAYFADIPQYEPVEFGWFDLSEGDYNAKFEDEVLHLQMWHRMFMPFPQDAILEQKPVLIGLETVMLYKLKIAIPEVDLDYVSMAGERRYVMNDLLDDPAITINHEALEAWESAWNTYIEKLKRIDELKAIGRYGYQLRMPGRAAMLAARRLRELDPEFCHRLGI